MTTSVAHLCKEKKKLSYRSFVLHYSPTGDKFLPVRKKFFILCSKRLFHDREKSGPLLSPTCRKTASGPTARLLFMLLDFWPAPPDHPANCLFFSRQDKINASPGKQDHICTGGGEER